MSARRSNSGATIAAATVSTVLLLATPALAQDAIDQFTESLKEATSFSTPDGEISLDFDFFVTLDNWVVSQPPPPIMDTGQNYLISPRFSMLGAFNVSDWMTIFALGNVDRGFDPSDASAQIRPDEYFLRLNPFDGIAKFTVGKASTVYGQWVNRHFSWENPMVNAPLLYEWISSVNATNGRVANKNAIANRSTWVATVWGPSYTTGLQFNGTIETFDYAFEIKNDALGSGTNQWDLWDHGIYGDALTYTGRLGWRPCTDWNLGVSASTGGYVVPGSFANWEDYKQTVVGTDVSWAHGPFEVWGEAAWSQWDVRAGPFSQAGEVSLVTYFIESKWKFAPAWWLAGRWNQQLPGDKPNSTVQWDDNVWRIDGCVGWHVNRSITLKAQYSYTDESGPIKAGEHVFDLQLVIGF